MPASHAQENAEIILALTRMGIYMERDRTKLDLLSASAQNSRLRKALDRAVENCCIFPLMFPEKEDREMGKLVVSNLPEWEGWRLPRKWEEGSRDQQSISEQLARYVKSMGSHSLYAPFQLGRSSVQESALYQGASVRLKDDVPDTALVLLAWVSFVNSIDFSGSAFSGLFWSLNPSSLEATGKAPTVAPTLRTACLALQPLGVFQVQLSDDIDDADNEKSDQSMYQAGFRGNKNRRAVPIVVVRYATALPSLGTQKNVTTLVNFAKIRNNAAVVGSHLTPTQLVLFSRVLDSNNRRLSPSEIAKYQSRVPKHIAAETKISFISPLYCPGSNLADQLEIGRRPRLSCAVCEVEAGADVKLFCCAACSGVMYCSAAHQSQNWQAHKADCRSKTQKMPLGIRQNSNQPSSPIVNISLPLDYYDHSGSDLKIGSKFTNYMNPAERIKPPRKAYTKPQPAKTVYAQGERFLVRARHGGHADRMFGLSQEDRRSGKTVSKDSKSQAMLEMVMGVIHFVDRPNSCGILLQKQTGIVGSSIVMSNPLKSSGFGENPFGNVNNTAIFEAVVNIIKRSDNEKDKGEAAYFWATRKGDCLEVDLVDLPDQSLGW